MFLLETHEGSAYERGLDHGRKFRHVIHANVHTWAFRQPFQGSDGAMDATIAPLRQFTERRAPDVFEELRGIAEGSGVDYPWIERMHFRVWGRLPNAAAPDRSRASEDSSGGCTGVGMLTGDAGAAVGGTLDDPRHAYVLTLNRPRDARAYLQIRWAGTTWGHNGVNESGLAIAQQSIGGFDPAIPCDEEALAIYSIVSTELLKRCDTVAQALDMLREWPDNESLILADRSGDLVAACCWGRQVFVDRPDARRMVWNSNQIHMPQAVAFGRRFGARPATNPYTQTRHDFLERFAAAHAGDLAMDDLRAVLRSTAGHPHSVCNDGTVDATIAPAQSEPGVLYVADRPPSRNPFIRYSCT